MVDDPRPLSPHLQVYKPQLTSTLSILHRATGIAMAVGFILFVIWLADMAVGPDAYAALLGWLDSTIGRVLLIGWSWAFFYHLANGIRHLVWDGPGKGFNPKVASQVSIFNFAFAIVGAAALMFAAMQS